jgi:ribonucleotide reductase alpha subunit
MAELAALGLWDDRMRRELIAAGGSVQENARIPADVRRRYRTAREIHPSLLGRTAKAVAPFVDQSLSLNAYFDRPDLPRILRFLVENWQAGLKTGMYYCHTQPAAGAQKTARGRPAAAATAAAAAPPRDCVPAADGSCTMCAL